MRPTLAAGDDTPRTPQVPQAPPDPQDVHDWPSPQEPQGRDDRQPDLVVRAGSPAALLTLVPHLLGFVPEVSLVVLGVEPPRHRIRITLRYDLPDPPEAGLVADVAAHAVAVLSKQRLTAAVVIGYGPEALVTPVARELRDAAWQAGIDLHESLRAEHGRYWSYACGDEECCPAAGVPFDVADPADAAALARIGPVLASRADLAARVAPLGGIAAESMRQATRRAEQHVTRLLGKVRKSARLGAARHMIAAEGLAAVGAMISRYRDGGRFTSDDEIARITVALRDLRVKMTPGPGWIPRMPRRTCGCGPTCSAARSPATRPRPPPCSRSWPGKAGDGALANVALDRALAENPGYSMASLLRQVIAAGAPPSLARLPMTPEEVAASYDGAEENASRDLDAPDPDLDDDD